MVQDHEAVVSTTQQNRAEATAIYMTTSGRMVGTGIIKNELGFQEAKFAKNSIESNHYHDAQLLPIHARPLYIRRSNARTARRRLTRDHGRVFRLVRQE